MRKLASIQEVREVIVHPNADLLSLAKINGWICVVKKGEFKAGDLGIYFEIDSFLPASDSRFAFLEKQFTTFDEQLGARIRTIRLRGELSQGLILPISAFPEIKDPEVNLDVTELLGIKKFEKPIPFELLGAVKGYFPSSIKQTDQERIQNLTDFDLSGEWEKTEKLDGTSMTVYLENGLFGVCSRNLDYLEDESNTLWKTARELNLEEKLRKFNKNIAIQGELLGNGIQSNRYKLKKFEFRIFDVYDIDQKRKLLPEERYQVLEELNTYDDVKLQTAPVLGYVRLPNNENWKQELILDADGNSILNEQTVREGFVYKHKEKNISFKVISNKYLLKYDE